MKLNKIQFIDEVRKLAHLEPSKELWETIWTVYKLYQNKTVKSVLEDRLLLNGQKEKYDDLQNFRWEYKRKVAEMYDHLERTEKVSDAYENYERTMSERKKRGLNPSGLSPKQRVQEDLFGTNGY